MTRPTSALNVVVACMEKHIEDFFDQDLKQIIEASQTTVEFKKRFLHSPNVDTHMRLQSMCKKELDRRGKSDLYRS